MIGNLVSSLGGDPGVTECSRAGCREPADWALQWRNPKIHAEDRRKTWLACPEHLEYLREFLAARSFPLEVVPVGELKSLDPEPDHPADDADDTDDTAARAPGAAQ